MRTVAIMIIILSLFVSSVIAEDEEENVLLSSIGVYRFTFGQVLYNDEAQMKMGNVMYQEGILLHAGLPGENAPAKHSYFAYINLNNSYSRLIGLIGIDDRSTTENEVTLIFKDDEKEIQKITMVPADLPVDVNLDVSGVRRLTLEVVGISSGDLNGKRLDVDLVNMNLWRLQTI